MTTEEPQRSHGKAQGGVNVIRQKIDGNQTNVNALLVESRYIRSAERHMLAIPKSWNSFHCEEMSTWTSLIHSYFPRPIEKLPSVETHFNIYIHYDDLHSEIAIISLNVLVTFTCHQRNVLLLCLFTKGRSKTTTTTTEINTQTKELYSTHAELIMETNFGKFNPAIVSSGN